MTVIREIESNASVWTLVKHSDGRFAFRYATDGTDEGTVAALVEIPVPPMVLEVFAVAVRDAQTSIEDHRQQVIPIRGRMR